MFKFLLLRLIKKTPFLRNIFLKLKLKRGQFVKYSDIELDFAKRVELLKPLNDGIRVGLVKDNLSYFEGYIKPRASYPKYERFFRNNNIDYEYFDIHRHDWMELAGKYSVVVWHTPSSPALQVEAMQKIYVLEQKGIKCLPSFNELFRYEDKVGMHFFYKNNNLPEIPTFVSYSKEDALFYANTTQYPLVSKITTGAASCGVEIVKSKSRAIRLINKVFSDNGKKTYWKYLRQKDYVYFQQFIDDAEYDLRIIVIGDYLFGYYRYPNKGDFRASGAGNYEKKAIPSEALEIAWDTKCKYEAHCLATDFVYSPRSRNYYIIESSIFFGIDTAEQLVVNGVSGRYRRIQPGVYSFEEGKYWVQELILQSFFNDIN